MNLDNVIIGPAIVSEVSQILEIQKAAFRYEAEIYGRDDLPPMRQTLESMIEDFGKYDFFKASYNKEIIGSVRALVKGNTCYIGRLVVLPKCHKHGIGSKLMDSLEQKYAGYRFELFTGKKSIDNIRFYSKRGYTIYDEFSEADNIVLVKMEKQL
ncbi:MAG TPA: GNAT family N-acetyltransferase [Bacteroidales bacterium]|nr:GNAT family N-acetyltransferase [Bacteroidales bacterium]